MAPKTSGATWCWINCSVCTHRGETPGAVLVSSHASYEMVQKAAMCGVEILFAVSAATSLAVEVAKRCSLTLVGFSKPGRAMVFTHPSRIVEDVS